MRPRSLVVTMALMAVSSASPISAQTKSEKPRHYQMRGVVVRVDPKDKVASIDAEKIEGWMDAMTMDYQVESTKEFPALRKGEKIVATVNVTSAGTWLTNVRERK
jgi:Cu/Ag efflux protein CusF